MLDNILKLFDMGEFNYYVWAAFGITLLVFFINIIFALKEAKCVKKQVERETL
jgi:heme exporter protein CcmD